MHALIKILSTPERKQKVVTHTHFRNKGHHSQRFSFIPVTIWSLLLYGCRCQCVCVSDFVVDIFKQKEGQFCCAFFTIFKCLWFDSCDEDHTHLLQ